MNVKYGAPGAMDIQGLGMVPMVIEQSGRGERSYDIYSRLVIDRAHQEDHALLEQTGIDVIGASDLPGGPGQ